MTESEQRAFRRLEQLVREFTDVANNVQRHEWPRGRYNRREIPTIVRDLDLALVHLDGCRSDSLFVSLPEAERDRFVPVSEAKKTPLLDKIEECTDHPLDGFTRDLRARLRRLSRHDLTALRDAFLLAYQAGYQRGELAERERW